MDGTLWKDITLNYTEMERSFTHMSGNDQEMKMRSQLSFSKKFKISHITGEHDPRGVENLQNCHEWSEAKPFIQSHWIKTCFYCKLKKFQGVQTPLLRNVKETDNHQ